MIVRKILALVLAVTCCYGWAQDLSSMMRPSVTVSFDASTNVDATLSDKDHNELARGRVEDVTTTHVSASMGLFHKRLGRDKKNVIAVAAMPFYDFSTVSLSNALDVEGYELNMPSRHHRYGLHLMAMYRTQAWSKPLVLMAMPFVNFSQYGYERAGAIVYGTLMLKHNERTQLGIAAVLLLGTSSSWPLFAAVTYNHRFNNQWSININGAQNSVSYRPHEGVTLKGVMDVKSSRYFFRPTAENLPSKAVWRQTNLKTGLQCDYDMTKHLTLTAFAGANLPMSGKICQANGSHVYARLRTKPLPTVSMSFRYKL